MSRPISRAGVSERLRPSVSMHTQESRSRELPLAEGVPAAPPPASATARRSQRIRDALRRWFDEDL